MKVKTLWLVHPAQLGGMTAQMWQQGRREQGVTGITLLPTGAVVVTVKQEPESPERTFVIGASQVKMAEVDVEEVKDEPRGSKVVSTKAAMSVASV